LPRLTTQLNTLVIVDNSGTQTWNPTQPDKVKNLWLIRVPYGLGLVGAWNLIVKSTPHAPYWVLVNDDAWFGEGALDIIAQDANPDGLSFPHISPEWSCIVLGQKVVEEVGLYDERLYPSILMTTTINAELKRLDCH
jgi:hypothetical protein